MKKKLISFGLVLAFSVSLCGAVAASAVVSQIKYYYVGTQQYANAAKVEVSGSGTSLTVNGSTRVELSEPVGMVAQGMLGASAELYDQDSNLVATAPYTVNSSMSYYHNSPNASYNSQISQDYYASGITYVWTGNGYQTETTYRTPLLSSANPYSVNEFGQTYGSALLAASYDERPELIAAVGRDGTKGYVYFTDLKADHPKTPEEALAQQESYHERMAAWDGKEILVVRTIPLYAVDGQTVIGEYDISFTPNGDNW